MNFLKKTLELLILPVIVGLIVYFVCTPKPKLSVIYAITSQKPYQADGLGQLHLDYKNTTRQDHFQLLVESIGTESIKDLEIDLVSMETGLFPRPTIIYYPVTIEKRVLDRDISNERIYLKISDLPQNTCLAIEMDTKMNFDEGDVKIAVIGSGRLWPPEKKEIILEKSKPSLFKKLFSLVNVSVSNTFAAEPPVKSEEENQQDNQGSGVFIGGYDPIRLTNEVFLLLQKKGVLTKSEAENIVKVTKQTQGDVSFSGVNVLKFDETVLNLLLQKKLITLEQGNAMLERARNAGGVLLNGYNIIHLKAEILNALIQKNIVSLSEAQSALDKAKGIQ